MKGADWNPNQIESWNQSLTEMFTDMDFLPNMNQRGVALTAIHRSQKGHKQFWLIAPGMGKTRVITSVAWLVTKKHRSVKDIYIVFASKELLDQDKEKFEELNDLMHGRTLHLCVGLKKAKRMTAKDVLIIDEADHILLDMVGELPKNIFGVFAVSATSTTIVGG